MRVDLFVIQTKDEHVKCARSELLTTTVAVTYLGPAYNYLETPFRHWMDVILGLNGQGCLVGLTVCFLCSYMDTEQYEEAVRDYEKIYKIDKTRGEYEKICKQKAF